MSDLRKRAEERLRATGPDLSDLSTEDVHALVHELQVHQIELQMQNETLLETQAELAEARDRYADLYEFAPVGYVTLDEDRIIREANSTACSMLGTDRTVLIGRRMDEVIALEHRDDCFRHIRSVGRSGAEHSFEAELLRSDGSRFWALVRCAPNGEKSHWPGGCRGTLTDITDQKATEESERRHAERLELALEAGDMGTWDWHLDDDKAHWDLRLYRLLGYQDRVEITPQTFFEHIHEDDRARVEQELEPALESCTEFRDEFRVVRRDGEIRWFASLGRIHRDTGGNPVRVVGVNFDTTERKALSETLERRVEQRTAQLRALAAQLSDAEEQERQRIAHILHEDLQQQLGALKITLNTLVPSNRRDAETQERMDEFKAHIDDAIQYTRELSREISPPTLRMHGLNPALQWLAESMQQKQGLDVALDLCPGAQPPSVAHAAMVYRAVKELLYNVVKHSGQSCAKLRSERVDGHLRISVSDEGNGFDPEAVTQKRQAMGSFGLLSIEERVAFLGGSMELSGGPNQGCCVTLTLPLQAEIPAPETANDTSDLADQPLTRHPAPDAAASPGTLRILLADDHDIMRESLAAMLDDEEDFAVVGQAADGAEAVRLAQNLRPDVVLMDVGMPGTNGIEATAAIRSALPKVRVVGLSMYDDADTRSRMLAAGAEALIPKGVSPEDIFETIRCE